MKIINFFFSFFWFYSSCQQQWTQNRGEDRSFKIDIKTETNIWKIMEYEWPIFWVCWMERSKIWFVVLAGSVLISDRKYGKEKRDAVFWDSMDPTTTAITNLNQDDLKNLHSSNASNPGWLSQEATARLSWIYSSSMNEMTLSILQRVKQIIWWWRRCFMVSNSYQSLCEPYK